VFTKLLIHRKDVDRRREEGGKLVVQNDLPLILRHTKYLKLLLIICYHGLTTNRLPAMAAKERGSSLPLDSEGYAP